jgi:hypothetical protein
MKNAMESNKPINVVAERICKSLTSGVRKLRNPEAPGTCESVKKCIA